MFLMSFGLIFHNSDKTILPVRNSAVCILEEGCFEHFIFLPDLLNLHWPR